MFYMKYTSTRGGMAAKPFTEILLGGLADDGGLAIPDHYPKLSKSEFAAMRSMNYRELAFEVISRFATDIPAADLKAIIAKAVEKNLLRLSRFWTRALLFFCPLLAGLLLSLIWTPLGLAFFGLYAFAIGVFFIVLALLGLVPLIIAVFSGSIIVIIIVALPVVAAVARGHLRPQQGEVTLQEVTGHRARGEACGKTYPRCTHVPLSVQNNS